MIKRSGVSTEGGDASGQNVCLKAIMQNTNDRRIDVIGLAKLYDVNQYCVKPGALRAARL